MKRLILCLFLLTGCLATKYQKKAWDGGYSETRLSKDMYQVTFEGNGYTKMQKASEGFLRRSAELTLESGFTHFEILGANRDISTTQYNRPNTYTATPTYGGGYNINQTGGGSNNINRPTHSGTIKLYSGDVPKDAIDAVIVLEEMAKQNP